MKYIKRIIGLPFFLGLNLVGMLGNLIYLSIYWIKYGGEAVTYMRKDEGKMIKDIYQEMVNQKYYYKN